MFIDTRAFSLFCLLHHQEYPSLRVDNVNNIGKQVLLPL